MAVHRQYGVFRHDRVSLIQYLGIIYLTLLLLSALVSIVLAGAAWSRRAQPGALPLALLGMALMILSVSSMLEVMAPTLAAKEMWVNVQYFGYAFIPVLYFVMLVQYLDVAAWTTPRRLAILFVIPVVTVLLCWTNDYHHLMRNNLHPEAAEGLIFLGKSNGPWWWVYLAYMLIIMAASVALLLQARVRSQPFFRGQQRVFIFGLLIPFVSSILYVCHISLSPNMDVTPAVAVVSGFIIAHRVLRYRLFDIVPVARDRLVDSLEDGVLVLDAHLRIIDMNPACERMLAVTPHQILGVPLKEAFVDRTSLIATLAAPPTSERIEIPYHDGVEERCWEVRVSPLKPRHGAMLLGRLALFHDITARKRAEKIIAHMAYHDRLTDLPNRELFQERITHDLAQARRRQEKLAVFMLDLDDFKEVNDTLGHHYGDKLLCEIATRLRKVVRDSDTLCRMGGDEFLVLQVDVTERAHTEILANRIRQVIATPVEIDGQILHMTTSIGISLFPDDGVSPEELLIHADEAMYQDKRGKKRISSPLT